MKKKNLSILLITCLSVSMLPINVQAKQANVVTASAITVSDEEPSTSSLEKVVIAVKSKISIPKSYTEFSHSYSERSVKEGVWYLSWSNDKGSINVICDNSGNIISYDNGIQSQGHTAPKYLKSELKSVADSFVKKVAPSVSKKVEYISAKNDGIYSGQYTYYYQRVENGIPMPDNYVSVAVNYETKKVSYANINWLYNAVIPSKEVAITKSQAASKMKNELKMELSYLNAYDTDSKGNTKTRAFLGFTPNLSYISIDAKLGIIYKTNSEWTSIEGGYTTADSATDKEESKADSKVTLTQSEINSIQELEGLITKKEAVRVVTSSSILYVDKNLQKATATLTKSYTNDSKSQKQYVWNINLTDPRTAEEGSKDAYRANAYATVDAKTGKILSFSASVPNSYDIGEDQWSNVKVKYTKSQAQDIFEKFVKEQIPDRFNKSTFYSNENDYVIAYSKDGEEVYGGYSYNYKRVNEGIRYLYNGIYGSVDGVTGKVYEFNSYWNEDITFESPKGAMNADDAFEKYISKEGYGLKYEINTKNDVPEVRLVYRADIMPNLISPFTGEQLDSNGEVYIEKAEYQYSDIDNTKEKRAILLLSDLGVGFEGGKFLPNAKITKEELSTLLTVIQSSEDVLSNAEKSQKIKRMDAVKELIKTAGLSKIANLSKIYKTDFTDNNKIPDSYLGYVALAKALGIVDGTKFRPTDYLTRAEAAEMIVNLMVAKSNLENEE